MRLAIRVFVEGKLTSAQALACSETELERLLPKLASDHAQQCAEKPTMIELEFLDEPDHQQRFFRIGSDPRGMVWPMRFDLADQ